MFTDPKKSGSDLRPANDCHKFPVFISGCGLTFPADDFFHVDCHKIYNIKILKRISFFQDKAPLSAEGQKLPHVTLKLAVVQYGGPRFRPRQDAGNCAPISLEEWIFFTELGLLSGPGLAGHSHPGYFQPADHIQSPDCTPSSRVIQYMCGGKVFPFFFVADFSHLIPWF